MLSRVWSSNIPLDDELAGDGDDHIRDLKIDLKERFEQDHFMDGVIDPLQGNCDGYHRKLTLFPQIAPVSIPAGAGILQSTLKNSKPELCFYKNQSGIVEIQLTKDNHLNIDDFLLRNTESLAASEGVSVIKSFSQSQQSVTLSASKRMFVLVDFLVFGETSIGAGINCAGYIKHNDITLYSSNGAGTVRTEHPLYGTLVSGCNYLLFMDPGNTFTFYLQTPGARSTQYQQQPGVYIGSLASFKITAVPLATYHDTTHGIIAIS